MNHEGEGENAEEDRVLQCDRRRVTFRCDIDSENHSSGDSDVNPKDHCITNGSEIDKHKQQSPECNNNSEEKLHDAETKESSGKIVGILRPRSISLSPQPFMPSTPRFKLSKLTNAMRRSNETRGCIEKLKEQIFRRLDKDPKNAYPDRVRSLSSQLKHSTENGENEPSFLMRQKRRMVCLESTKAMMGQSLPPTMMPFVEEAIGAAHFLRRRRKENGHGRIVHKILIEQHKRVQKELEQKENRNGDTTHSSRQQSYISKSP